MNTAEPAYLMALAGFYVFCLVKKTFVHFQMIDVTESHLHNSIDFVHPELWPDEF